MSKIFPTPPSVSYRQARNLKQLMVRSRLKALPHNDTATGSQLAVINTSMAAGAENASYAPGSRRELPSRVTTLEKLIKSDII